MIWESVPKNESQFSEPGRFSVVLALGLLAVLFAPPLTRRVEASLMPNVVVVADSVPQDVLNMIGTLAAYHDSIGNNADSLRAETCRGGTLSATGRCYGRKYAPRTTKLFVWSERIRHHKYRADSVMNQYVIHK